MKRLLAYLFIVLGLGLTFNVNADAKELQICLNHLSKDNIQVIRYKYSLGPNNYGCRSIFKSDAPKLYKKIIKSYSKTKLKFGGKKIYSLKKKDLEDILVSHNINSSVWLSPKNFYSMKEPSQKQKIDKYGNIYLERKTTSKERQDFYDGKIRFYQCVESEDKYISNDDCISNYKKKSMHRAKTYFLDIYFIRDYTGAQIAKAEPSQTQKVAEKDKIKLILCKDNEKKSRYYPFLKDEWIDGQCPKSTPVKISYDEYKLSKQTICLREKQGNDTPAYLILSKNDVSCDVGIDHTVEIKFDGEDFYLKKNKLTKQLKIAKIDPRQNQKVSKSETTVKLVFKGQYVCLEGDTNCGKYSPSGPISFNKWKSRKSSFNKNGLCMSPEFGTVFYAHTIDNCDHYEKTYSKKYYRLTNLKDNVFKIDGYIGKVAINKFDDSTGQGEGSSVVAKKVAKKIKNVVTAIICNTSKNRTEYQLWIYNTEFLSSNNCKKLNKNFSNFSYKDYTLLQKNSDILLSETYKSKRVYLTKKYNYPICFSEDRKISIGSQHCTTSILEKDTYKELEVLESDDHIIYLKIKGTKTQFAKKETEQKDEYLYNWYAIAKHPKTNFEFIATKVSNKDDAKKIAIKKCYNFVTNQLNKKGYNDCFIDLIIDKRDNLQLAEDITLKQQDQITQIAKVVPGPNKQIKKDDFKCTWKSIDKVINFSINKKKIVDYGGYKYPIIFENNKYIMFVSSNDYGGIKLFNKNTKELSSSWALNKTDAIVDLKTNRSMPIYANCKKIIETQIAKVEEPKQEEFKPKKTNQDNEAPVIEIAENITVDSQTYTLKGKVKDKSRFQLTIDDRTIKVAKNGQFEFEGFAIDSKEQLKIVAIDRWKNKSEKIINIEVKIKQVADLRSYEKPNPSKIKVKKDNNKIGIIVGIEKYQNLNNIDAPYANRDAKAFKAYANIALGIPNNNLKVLIDEDATRGELLKSLKIWLPQITRGKGKDIYIFFAGHGLASDNGEDLHILPHNGDPILLEDTALSRIQMFDLINKVSPKSVTMFFDTCYSGQTRSEQMLVAGLRPLRIVADEQDTPNNFTIFTASNYDQTSGSINEAEHGIFSYYLMKGLEGNADTNKDKKLTNGELIAYLKNKVSQEAFTQNRSQEPMLAGDPDKVLMSYR